jgi:hypothetical protein
MRDFTTANDYKASTRGLPIYRQADLGDAK